MTVDRLKNYVLRCADDDPDLTDDARLVVLAALGDPDDRPTCSETTPPHRNSSTR